MTDHAALIAELRLWASSKVTTDRWSFSYIVSTSDLIIRAADALDQAEAELLESRLYVEEMDELLSERWEEGRAARAEVARLTSALADAREAERERIACYIDDNYEGEVWRRRELVAEIRALPTAEPAKAEDQS